MGCRPVAEIIMHVHKYELIIIIIIIIIPEERTVSIFRMEGNLKMETLSTSETPVSL